MVFALPFSGSAADATSVLQQIKDSLVRVVAVHDIDAKAMPVLLNAAYQMNMLTEGKH